MNTETTLGDSKYPSDLLDRAFKKLPTDTVMKIQNGPNYPAKITFEYGGDEWMVYVAPRVDTWGAENWGGDPKGKLAVALQKARDKSKEPKKPLKIEKLDGESFSADARELYRTDPKELLELARREGLECMYCEGSSFHNPYATPYSKATGGATIYYPCDCGETQVVITDKKWGAESFSATKGIDTFTEPFEEIGVPKWLIGIGGVVAAITGINYLSKKL